MYGAQAQYFTRFDFKWFENDVEMYGAQALKHLKKLTKRFENDVEMYGAQAVIVRAKCGY